MAKVLRIRKSRVWVAAAVAGMAMCGCSGDAELRHVLNELDRELELSTTYIDRHQAHIDSLRLREQSVATLDELARNYTSFNNDSALTAYDRAIELARSEGCADSTVTRLRLSRAALMPLGGFMLEATREYESIDTAGMTRAELAHYYNCGRRMFSFLSSFYDKYSPTHDRYQSLAQDAQRHLLSELPHNSLAYNLNLAEYLHSIHNYEKSRRVLANVLEHMSPDDKDYGRAAHIMAQTWRALDNRKEYMRYLALSAISDLRNATREVTSLQEMGQVMFEHEEVERAHHYLYAALRNAVECNAEARMIQTAAYMPIIENVHRLEQEMQSRNSTIAIVVMAITLLSLICSLVMLRRKMKQMGHLQKHLEGTNNLKEIYITQFLNLCSIYMEKLTQLSQTVTRKISAGQIDELYRLTNSGKFVENQSREFYEVFDEAFINIHPGFVEGVNRLLQPDKQIVLGHGEKLNTELRILAFMRLGINDTARIAQILNYSVNTIYTYRNKLKNKAVDRDGFESAVQNL